jgi:type I restriction enzyme S subunit
MENELFEYRLEDCMDAIIDYRGKTPKKTDSGIPLITAKIIKHGRIQEVKEFIAETDYESWMRRGIPEPGDIVLTTEAPLGEVAQLDDRKIALAQRVITLRGKKGLLENDYLKYLLISSDFQHQLDGRGTGTTVKGIKQSELREVLLSFPNISIQRAIAHILKTLDSKVELNQKTNQTLEHMAQALFKSWFVDFDPVFDNAFDAGLSVDDFPDELQHRAMLRQQHRSEAMQQDSEAIMPQTPQSTAVLQPQNQQATQTESERIRGLFPSEFEQCDDPSVGINGWIPKDWRAKSVSEVINVNPRTSLPKNSIAKFADMKALPTIGYMVNQITKKEFSGGAKFKQHDILLARITPCLENGKTALVDFLNDEEVGFGSTEFIVLRQKNKLSYSFIACLARDENFRKHCIQNMVGSSGRQRVQNSCFDIYLLSVPSNEKIFEKFTDLTKPNFEKMTINNNEINYLSKIRDTLLPKLISGELQLSEAVQSIETK